MILSKKYYSDIYFKTEKDLNDVLKRVSRVEHPLIDILYQNGLTLYNSNSYSEAIKYFQMVLEIDKSYDNGSVNLIAAKCLVKIQEYDDAETLYLLGMKLINDNWDKMVQIRIDFAILQNRLNKFAESNKFLDEALNVITVFYAHYKTHGSSEFMKAKEREIEMLHSINDEKKDILSWYDSLNN